MLGYVLYVHLLSILSCNSIIDNINRKIKQDLSNNT